MTWIGLVVGNSRFHWGLFQEDSLVHQWDTPHCSEPELQELHKGGFAESVWARLGIHYPQDCLPHVNQQPELWIATVVDTALEGLISYPQLNMVERRFIPLEGLYDTVGVDRALSLLGAGEQCGWPVLVIDCGTALTFTAGVKDFHSSRGALRGGAILPGLGLQFRALAEFTDRLPAVNYREIVWPQRWETTTQGAIASGILHTQLAGIRDFLQDWWRHYPKGKAVFTGGDGATIVNALNSHGPPLFGPVYLEQTLAFLGLSAYRRAQLKDR